MAQELRALVALVEYLSMTHPPSTHVVAHNGL